MSGSTWTAPKRYSVGCLAVLVDERGCVLLVRVGYGGGRWQLPGGYMEASETPETTVVRECMEELGVLVEPKQFLGASLKLQTENLSLVFRCEMAAGSMEADGKEVLEFGYFSLGELPHALSPRSRKIVELATRPGGEDPFLLTFPED